MGTGFDTKGGVWLKLELVIKLMELLDFVIQAHVVICSV